MCHKFWRDARFHAFLLDRDRDSAEAARKAGCECGGVLHSAVFPRKPRGVPGLGAEHDVRFSFCCAVDGCRGRVTPPSLRFLNRKVYLGFVVVLISAMDRGKEINALAAFVGVSRRTVERWRVWWRTLFARSPFWRGASGQLVPAVAVSRLPASLLERFLGDAEAQLVALLGFLGPITGGAKAVHAR